MPCAQEWDKLWALNKKIIDPVCPRHTAVAAEGRALLRLNNGPEAPEVVTVPRHKKHPPAGVKATTRTKVRAHGSCLVPPSVPCRGLLGFDVCLARPPMSKPRLGQRCGRARQLFGAPLQPLYPAGVARSLM